MAWLLTMCGISALVNWWAVERRQRRWVLITKPATMIFLIAWVVVVAPQGGFLPAVAWLLAGFFLSLVGDVLLMAGLRFFKAGLLAFLAAHVCYVIHFQPLVPAGAAMPAGILAAGLLLAGILFNRRVFSGLQQTGRTRLFRAVIAYTVVISLMVLAATLRIFDPSWPRWAALGAMTGALFFFASDLMNARRRFIAHFAHEELWVMSTYHAGQILLAVSTVLKLSQNGF